MTHRTVFIGDSVTDCGRLEFPPYGDGYVRNIVDSGRLGGTIINVGTSGHRLVDLLARWQHDVLDAQPTRVSIAIGVNDTWRRYDDDDVTTAEDFEANYRFVLARTAEATGAHLVLCEPFLLPVAPEMLKWREDLDPKIDVVHRLAREFGATLVAFDATFTVLAKALSMADLAGDGIHPTPHGHQVMADLWLETVLP